MPETYTREDMARAWDEGVAAGGREGHEDTWDWPDNTPYQWNPYRDNPPGAGLAAKRERLRAIFAEDVEPVCDCGSWDGGHQGDCAIFTRDIPPGETPVV